MFFVVRCNVIILWYSNICNPRRIVALAAEDLVIPTELEESMKHVCSAMDMDTGSMAVLCSVRAFL